MHMARMCAHHRSLPTLLGCERLQAGLDPPDPQSLRSAWDLRAKIPVQLRLQKKLQVVCHSGDTDKPRRGQSEGRKETGWLRPLAFHTLSYSKFN